MVKARGGIALKLGGLVGIPDRLILLPKGRALFVEFKRPGEKPRAIQWWWLKKLRALGFVAEYVDNKTTLGNLMDTS